MAHNFRNGLAIKTFFILCSIMTVSFCALKGVTRKIFTLQMITLLLVLAQEDTAYIRLAKYRAIKIRDTICPEFYLSKM